MQTFSSSLLVAAGLFACPMFCRPAHGEHATLYPAADTTLIQAAPTNNMGRQPFFNAGTTRTGQTNRGIFRFHLLGQVPAGSRILQASLVLEVVGQPPANETRPSTFLLHRLLQPWGEGDKLSEPASPGLGVIATAGEATWLHRFAFTTNTWTVPGAAPDSDFRASPSASQFIEDLSDYTFGPGPDLAGDIQLWIDHPESNHGWLLRTLAETTPFTVRRFASREDSFAAPRLEIELIPPPRITGAQLLEGQFRFSFDARGGQSYQVQFRDALAGQSWSTLTSIQPPAAATNVTVADPLGPSSRFYRVVIPATLPSEFEAVRQP